MPVLIFLLIRATKLQDKYHKIVLVALIASCAGDVFLMFKNEDYFLFGVGSFLICQVMYIIAYSMQIKRSVVKATLMNKISLSLLPLFYTIAVYLYMFPSVAYKEENQPFLIPLTVYATSLFLMGVFALWRLGSSNRTSSWLIIGGAMSYLISDSLIAINKFVTPIQYSFLFIMLTYCVAQFCIVLGIVYHKPVSAKS